MKHTVEADYAGAGATHDSRGEFTVRARDRRDSDRAVVIHMTYEQMIDARDRLTALIENPPAWTRAGRERSTSQVGPEGRVGEGQFVQGQPVIVTRQSGVTSTGRVALEHTSGGFVGVRSDTQTWRITRYPRAEVSPAPAECPTCGAPADQTGTNIPEHRPGSPCTVDYRPI